LLGQLRLGRSCGGSSNLIQTHHLIEIRTSFGGQNHTQEAKYGYGHYLKH
jgi:hypothetical protein